MCPANLNDTLQATVGAGILATFVSQEQDWNWPEPHWKGKVVDIFEVK